LWVAIRSLLTGVAIGVAGGAAGAVVIDWLTRRRAQSPGDLSVKQGNVAMELPDRDEGYSVEWIVEGPVQLSAQDARITLRPN
jgi:hypothetical protein